MKKEIFENMKKHNKFLSKYACSDEDAIRFEYLEDDIRTSFFRDIDRIIYSLSYIRYNDKTQVFTNCSNDMVSKRMIHVQLVSKIARTIGRALGLNEDLIEAASLGHDLGHVPFGHNGESILNKISLEHGEGNFYHNVQSVRILMYLENNGSGSNISLQVLDAIFCHNGEILKGIYEPVLKTKEEFLSDYENSYYDKSITKNAKPMTLEGCVVRVSDVIAYIGKDVEDAVRLGIINKDDIPKSITDILGNTNSQIVDTIIKDIISNSFGKNYIKMSSCIFSAMEELIKFNYENIYHRANTEEQILRYEKMFNDLFSLYYEQVLNNKTDEDIYTLFLNDMNDDYNREKPVRKVIDYIALMTDDFFLYQYDKYFGVR